MNNQSINQFNQSIYLHQTTWIHITIKENTRNDRIKNIKKKRQEKIKNKLISKKNTRTVLLSTAHTQELKIITLIINLIINLII